MNLPTDKGGNQRHRYFCQATKRINGKELSKTALQTPKRSQGKYYHWKCLKENSLFNLFKKIDTTLRLENVDVTQSVSMRTHVYT